MLRFEELPGRLEDTCRITDLGLSRAGRVHTSGPDRGPSPRGQLGEVYLPRKGRQPPWDLSSAAGKARRFEKSSRRSKEKSFGMSEK